MWKFERLLWFIVTSSPSLSLSTSPSLLITFLAKCFCACKIVDTVSRVSLEGSLERSELNSSEMYEAMQRY